MLKIQEIEDWLIMGELTNGYILRYKPFFIVILVTLGKYE